MSGATEKYSLLTAASRAHACKRAGKFGDNLSCNARDVPRAKLPGARACVAPHDQLATGTCNMQDQRCIGELGTSGPQAQHNACDCGSELPSAGSVSTPLHEHYMAPAVAAGAPTSQHSWRPASDQNLSTHNAALHRALASLKKTPSGEAPDTLKKLHQRPPLGHVLRSAADQSTAVYSDINERSITSTDARTLSMRERGRWGNNKMQQQLPGSEGSLGSHGHLQKPNLSTHIHHEQAGQQAQTLQHVQCLHCGSFSTTPVAATGAGGGAGVKGARSQSFGRRVRDYSWQQELLHEQMKPLEQQHMERHFDARPVASERINDQCEFACCREFYPQLYEHGGAPAAGPRPFKADLHHHPPMSWQERYMLLCQAIAVGAFVDSTEEYSGPLPPRSARAGYSWADCECPACEVSMGGNGRGGSFGRPHGSTSSGERMMELEAFSGPLGYVSESKGMAELSTVKEKLGRRGASRWWARLPSFGKAKSSSSPAAPSSAPPIMREAGQKTAQCMSCGQRVWASRGSSEGEIDQAGRLCPDCMAVRGGGGSTETDTATPPTATHATSKAAQATAAAAAGRHRFNTPPNFSFHHHHQKHSSSSVHRRWRLMKLCRYLMGFPMQR